MKNRKKSHLIRAGLKQLAKDIKKSILHVLKRLIRKYVKKPLVLLLGVIKKYLNLLAVWIRLKNIDEISEKHFEMGHSMLATAKKETERRLGKRIVREFDTIAEQKAEKLQARPKDSFRVRIFVMQRIKYNVLELLHPIRLIKQAKKTKEMAYVNGWTEVKK